MSLPWRRAVGEGSCAAPAQLRSDAPVPGDEIREQLETGAVAFLWMELHGKDISAGNRASKRRRAVNAGRHRVPVPGDWVIAVSEIKSRAVVDPPPQRMFAHSAPRTSA